MKETILEALKQLNNREISVGVWLLVSLIAMLWSISLRRGLIDVLKSLLSPKLILLFGSFAVYVAFLVWLLSLVGLWTFDQLTATVLWYFLSGVGLLSGVFSITEGDQHFRKLFRGAFALTAVVEFVAVAYTFDITIELFLVPMLVVLGLLLAVSETKSELVQVKLLLEWIMVAVALVLVWASIRQILDDTTAFFSTTTGRNFLLPIALTLGSVPVLYMWYAITKIENAFISIDLKNHPPEALKRYARRRFTWAFLTRPWLLQRAIRQFHALPIKTRADVDRMVDAIREYERLAKTPPQVAVELGWSPFLTRDLLTHHGLRTSDYHVAWDQEEYFASSSYVDLDDGLLPNHAAFYVEGTQEIAKTLKLKGDFRHQSDTNAALERFQTISRELVRLALNVGKEEAQSLVPNTNNFRTSHGGTEISWHRQSYPSGQGFEIRFTLTR